MRTVSLKVRRTGRHRCTLCLGVVVSVWLLAGTGYAQDAIEWISGPGQLLKAVLHLEGVCRCPIMTEVPAPASFKDRDAQSLKEERSQHEALGFQLSIPPARSARASVVAALLQAVAEYNAAGITGAVRVDTSGLELRIVPEAGSLLDAPRLTLPDKEWVFVEAIQEIALQLSRNLDLPVAVTDPNMMRNSPGGWEDLTDARLRFSATAEPASQVLERLLRATGRKISWYVGYQDVPRRYGLTLRFADPRACRSAGGKTVCYDGDAERAVYPRAPRRLVPLLPPLPPN